MTRVMVFSLRPGGYRRGGVHYGPSPVAYEVVADREGETPGAASARRVARKLTRSEVQEMRDIEKRDAAAGQTPSLSVIDGISESASLDQEVADKRAMAAAMDERTRAAEMRLAALAAEHQAAETATQERVQELAALTDQQVAAQRAVQALEEELGSLTAVTAELKAAKATIRKLERKLEQAK